MVRLSRAPARSGQASTGVRPSIREVSILGSGAMGRQSPGEPLAWAGRTYRVAALDGGGYVHVRPDDQPLR